MTVYVDRENAYIKEKEIITSGSVGHPIDFVFSEDWDNLSKTVVFKAGDLQPRHKLLTGNETTISPEVLSVPGNTLTVGIIGMDGEEEVIPTIYCVLGYVEEGASISGQEEGQFTPSLYEQTVALLAAATSELSEVKQTAIKEVDVDDSAAGSVGTPSVSLSTSWIDSADHNKGLKATFTFANLKGQTGNGIASTVLNADYTLTITFTDGTSYTTPSIRGATGADGVDGNDGEDGFSPIITITEITGGHTVHITDATHSESFHVMDGIGPAKIEYFEDEKEIIITGSESYQGSYSITPRLFKQTLDTNNKVLAEDLEIEEIPVAQVSNPQGGRTATIG